VNDLRSQLLGTFLEESAENLERLEAGLLALEAGFDAAVVDEIFRAAHSLKGGAGTFGFGAITGLAHDMETLLDEVRAGILSPGPELLALLLEGLDALRVTLQGLRAGGPSGREGHPQDAHPALRQRLQRAGVRSADAAARASAAAIPSTVTATVTVGPPAPAAAVVTGGGQPVEESTPKSASGSAPAPRGWDIGLRPRRHMLESGNEPWRLIRELEGLGAVSVKADLSALPGLAEMVPTACYLSWRIRLEAAVPRAAVEEIFAWVAEDAELTLSEWYGDAVPARAASDEAAPVTEPARHREERQRATSPIHSRDDGKAGTGGARSAEGEPAQAMASLRVGIDKIDALMNMVGELVITQSILGALDDGGPLDEQKVTRIREGLSLLARNSRALQESVMSLRSVPVSAVFNRFPRLVHDLSRQLGKRVELVITGQTTELDKTVLEKLGDPLVHLVRNSLDHGLETPGERRAAGKPETGRLALGAVHRGADIFIEVEDDGRGLDAEKILRRARERGLVAPTATPSPAEVLELIFAPGFSTAEVVSDLSGRGVGMDVVRRNVKSLGGEIALESRPGHGTKVRLRLPLTLAIIDGQLVRAGEHAYVIPLLSIVESVQIEAGRVRTIAGAQRIYRLRDQLIPLVELAELLGVGATGATAVLAPTSAGRRADTAARAVAGKILVIVETDGRRLGLVVDALEAQQQVVIKSLEANYGRVAGLAGATILGDGNVAFIIDIIDMLAKLDAPAADAPAADMPASDLGAVAGRPLPRAATGGA
jgi:two-component system chemotaxis sensor kinase CheA